MVGLNTCSRLGRTSSTKRKRSDLAHDVDGALRKLRQLTNHLEASSADESFDFKSLVDLLQIQTVMIEALASHHYNTTPKQQSPIERARQFRPQRSIRRSKQDRKGKSLEDIAEADVSAPPVQGSPAVNLYQTTSEPPLQPPTNRILQLLTPPHTPERQQQKPREILEVPFKISSSLLPPTPPPKDNPKSSTSSHRAVSPKPPSHTSSPRLSSTTLNTRPCPTCTTKQWVLSPQQPDPLTTDLTRETTVQHAATQLLTSTHPTPIGPLTDGVFTLHSSSYRQHHYCVHDRPDRQSLLVYSSSTTWSADFPGIPPPRAGEIAMELLVYPDCLVIVKPFRAPRWAGWKWHTLEAMGDHAKPTSVDVMFLGHGCLKLKVRLSELLGWARMKGESDRFVEFSGVWAPVACADDDAVWETC